MREAIDRVRKQTFYQFTFHKMRLKSSILERDPPSVLWTQSFIIFDVYLYLIVFIELAISGMYSRLSHLEILQLKEYFIYSRFFRPLLQVRMRGIRLNFFQSTSITMKIVSVKNKTPLFNIRYSEEIQECWSF